MKFDIEAITSASEPSDIYAFYHCSKCLEELPSGESPEGYARLSFGATSKGFQVRCVRHRANVITLLFPPCRVIYKTEKPIDTVGAQAEVLA